MLPQEYFTFQSLYEVNSDIKQTIPFKDLAESVFDEGVWGHDPPENFEILMS